MGFIIHLWAASWQNQQMTVHPAKTQISLGICPVWSESSLCAQWVAKDPSILHADSEDSDQTGQMPRLIWVFAGRTTTLLVLSWGYVQKMWRKWQSCKQCRPWSDGSFRSDLIWSVSRSWRGAVVNMLVLQSWGRWFDPMLLQSFGWDFKPRSRRHGLVVSGTLN